MGFLVRCSRTVRLGAPRCFHLVLHDQRDAPAQRIKRRIGFAQPLVRKSVHLRHMIFAKAVLHHQSSRCIQFVYAAVGG